MPPCVAHPLHLEREVIVGHLQDLTDLSRAGSSYKDVRHWIIQVRYLLAQLSPDLLQAMSLHLYDVQAISEGWAEKGRLILAHSLIARLSANLVRFQA